MEITEQGWDFVGYLVRERRQFLGLRQEDLHLYGGPKKTTVGKIENGRLRPFPTKTQHQVENALGWRRGTIRELFLYPQESFFNDQRDSIEADYIENNIPDLSKPVDPSSRAHRASELSDEELLAELTYRMKRYAEQQQGGDGDAEAAERGSAPIELRRKVSERTRRTDDLPAVAHEEGDIEREQEESEEGP
jgi:DNA-binding XRE family transcriptional regulator